MFFAGKLIKNIKFWIHHGEFCFVYNEDCDVAFSRKTVYMHGQEWFLCEIEKFPPVFVNILKLSEVYNLFLTELV